jgi:hypothetical protein
MRRKAGSKLKPIAEPPEQPEVIFTLEMREKMHGVWRRRSGNWVSTTAWTIDLTQKEYETLHRYIGGLRKAQKGASHAA